MTSSNPKILVMEHYDSLTRQIDIHAEEQLDKFSETNTLDSDDDSRSLFTNALDASESNFLIESYQIRLKIFEESYGVNSYHDPYSDEYVFDSASTIYRPQTGQPTFSLSTASAVQDDKNSKIVRVRDYVTRVREEMLIELERVQAEALGRCDAIRNELTVVNRNTPDRIEKLRAKLFSQKFAFIQRIDQIMVSSTSNKDFVPNPSPFKLYLFVIDFYLDKNALTLLKYLLDGVYEGQMSNSVRNQKIKKTAPHPKTNLNMQSLLIHMLKTYINGMFKCGGSHQFHRHIYHIDKSEILSISKVVYSYLFSLIESVKFSDLVSSSSPTNQLDLSNLKSLEIHIVVPYFVTDFVCELVDLTGLDRLEHLYIQNVQLTCTPFKSLVSLRNLELSNCDFANANADVFECLPLLEVLKNSSPKNSSHISYEKLTSLRILEIKNFTDFAFLKRLSKNLTVLKIICSSIQVKADKCVLNAEFCHPNLQVLHLVRNQIEHFDGQWLSGLTGLRHLIITDILLRTINLDYPFLATLESVYLNNNLMLNLTSNIFSRLSGVHKLYLAYVNLDKLLLNETTDKKQFLCGLGNLELLDLRENHLTRIDPEMFALTPNLSKLDLSGNELKLERGIFSRLGSLKLLDLSHNKLTSIEDEIFSSLSQLEILNLYDNLISQLGAGIFNGLENLRKICLGRNRFKYIRPDSFVRLKNLEEVVLTDMSDLSESNKKDISEFYPPSVNFKF